MFDMEKNRFEDFILKGRDFILQEQARAGFLWTMEHAIWAYEQSADAIRFG